MQLRKPEQSQTHLVALSSLEMCLKTLEAHYLHTWPNSDNLFKTLIFFEHFYPDIFLKILQEFKSYINNPEVIHPNSKTGIEPSDAFKKLNAILDSSIAKQKPPEVQNASIDFYNGLEALGKIIIKHPYKSLFALLCFVLCITALTRRSTVTHYLGIPATDISGLKIQCMQKIGASEGKKCRINYNLFFMKKLKNPAENQGNNIFLGEYNRRFLQATLGVRVPDTEVLCETKNDLTDCFIGSKYIAFSEANTLCKEKVFHCTFDRIELAAAIGEKGIAQMAVIHLLIKDLHPSNWGYKNNEVVIIDTDQSPKDLYEYVDWSSNLVKAGMGFQLSKNNLLEMKKILKNMLQKTLPTFHKDLDMSRDLYEHLINFFISACGRTIEEIDQYSDLEKNPQQDSQRVNNLLSENLSYLAPALTNPFRPR
jgi:hypothetical protein